jgi:uncharacterized repeat protein (TIGR01451 family)
MASGDVATIQLVVTVDDAATDDLENVARVSGPNTDTNPANDEDNATTAVELASDLAIEKRVSVDRANPRDTLTYTLDVTNNGPSDTASARVTDTLPAGLEYVSDDSNCDDASLPELTCDLGPMADGDTATIAITARVRDSALGELINSAAVSGPNVETDLTNNAAAAPVTVDPVADLDLTKTVEPGNAKPGEKLTYALAVHNNGPSDVPSATVTDTLPSDLAYVSDTAGCDTTSLPAVSCVVGPIANGQTVSFELVARVRNDAKGDIENSASVSSSVPDPTADDTTSAALADVKPERGGGKTKPRLKVNKETGTETARPGEVIAYRITVRNVGKGDAKKVKVCDVLPEGLDVLRAPGANVGDGKACWKIKRLKAGAKRTFKITAQVAMTATDTLTNRAKVKAANAARGSDSERVGVNPATGACRTLHLRRC